MPQIVKARSRLPIKRYPIIIRGIFRSNVDKPGLMWNQYRSKRAIPLIPPSASLLGMLMASKLKAYMLQPRVMKKICLKSCLLNNLVMLLPSFYIKKCEN